MAQKLELSESIEDMKTLLDGIRKMEGKNLKGSAHLPDMSIDQIELLVASYYPRGHSRKNAILLRRLFEDYKQIDTEKLVRDRIPHSKSFGLFPKLPLELRRCIWGQALPGPQVIEIYHHETVSGLRRVEVATASQVRLMRLMKVCHEAKEVVRSNFRAVDARAFGIESLPIGATILVNYFQDVINLDGNKMLWGFLSFPHANARLGAEELANIQFLAIYREDFDDFTYLSDIGRLKYLKSLKKLFVVVLESHQSSTRRDHCRRDLQIQLCVPRSDPQHIIQTHKEKWSNALKTSSRSKHLASLKIEFVNVHMTRDKRNTSFLVSPMIKDEIRRMELLQQAVTIDTSKDVPPDNQRATPS